MRLKLSIGLILFTLTLNAMAGMRMQGKFDYDKFKAEKVAFITEAIDLTPGEAQKFWPVYNEFERKRWELMKEHRELDKSLQEDLKKMSEKEYIELSRKLASFPHQEGELVVEYNEKFLKILSPKKVVELYVAELDFRNTMLRKYRDHDRKKD
ncbi:hypothetical protein [Roseimarinus sediminis]|uniref:hypothetical protein n=1 Tax=Roseimarinus sediminis TaxID=1610899 RepID=UPI003D214F58